MYQLLYGKSGAEPDLSLPPGAASISPENPRQGAKTTVCVRVSNAGRPARGVDVALYLDAIASDSLLASKRVDVAGAGETVVQFTVDTT